MNTELIEPRPHVDMVRDLLDALKCRMWVSRNRRCGKGCCSDWTTECSSCEAEEGDDYDDPDTYRQHKPGCPLSALILEAETFLEVEETLEREREARHAG